MSVKFLHKNPNALKKILKRYEKLPSIAVGFPSSKTKSIEYPDGESVVVVAARNNFGVPEENIPRRPFMELSSKPAQKVASKLTKKLFPQLTKGTMSIETIADLIGIAVAPIFKRTAVELRTPPNSPRTIAKKKSDNPLVDTGLLVQSITYEVVKKKGVK